MDSTTVIELASTSLFIPGKEITYEKWTWVWFLEDLQTCMHTLMCTIHTYRCTYIYMHKHICIHTHNMYVYIYVHTHQTLIKVFEDLNSTQNPIQLDALPSLSPSY